MAFQVRAGVIGAPVAWGNLICHPCNAVLVNSDGIVVVPNLLIIAMPEEIRAREHTEAGLRAKMPAFKEVSDAIARLVRS